MKNVLITGGAGFIGSNLIHELLSVGGYSITVIDNESNGDLTPLSDLGIKCVKEDIRSEATIAPHFEGIDTVIHLAADTRVIDSIANPLKNFEVNVQGTFNLLRLSREAGVKTFINASTGGAILGEAPAPIHEEINPKPLSPYGASKLATEAYCSAFAASYGMNTLSLRFSNIYGPGSYHKGSVVAHFYKQLLKAEDLVIYGDGTQVRDFLYVGDLVKGLHRAIQQPHSGVYQLGSGRPTSINELVSHIRQTLSDKLSFKVVHKPERRGEIHTTWCDISKAREAFQFMPSTPLATGLSTTWNWFNHG